jgi:hypothetical protein
MVSLFLLFLTLEGAGILIGIIGTLVGIGFQIADYKKSGRKRRKARHRKKRVK